MRGTTRRSLVLLPLSLGSVLSLRSAFSVLSLQSIATIAALLCLALPAAGAAEASGAGGASGASTDKRADADEPGIFAEPATDDARQIEAVALLTEAVAKGLVAGRTQPLLDLVGEGQITDVLLHEATQRWGLSEDRQARLAVGLVEGWRKLAAEMARAVKDAFPHLMPARAEQGHIVATVRFDLPEARNYLLFRYRPSSRGPRLVNIEYPLLGMDLVDIMLTRMPRHRPPRISRDRLPDTRPRGQVREVATKTVALLFALVAIAWAFWRRGRPKGREGGRSERRGKEGEGQGRAESGENAQSGISGISGEKTRSEMSGSGARGARGVRGARGAGGAGGARNSFVRHPALYAALVLYAAVFCIAWHGVAARNRRHAEAVREWQLAADRQRLVEQSLAGRHAEAETLARKLAVAAPDDALMRCLLAGALMQQKKHGEAKPILEHMVRQDQAPIYAHHQLAMLALAEGRQDDAMRHLGSVLDGLGNDDAIMVDIAGVYAMIGKMESAREWLGRALAANPRSFDALILRARLAARAGELDAAAADLRAMRRHHLVDPSSLARDPDFKRLRDSPEFADVFAPISSKK